MLPALLVLLPADPAAAREDLPLVAALSLVISRARADGQAECQSGPDICN